MSEKSLNNIDVAATNDFEEKFSISKRETIEEHLIKWDRPWYKVKNLVLLNFWLVIITLTSVEDGFDGSLLNGLQSLESWQEYFHKPTGAKLGVLSCGFSIGNLIVLIAISSWISDRYGRKVPILLGQLLSIVGAVIQGSSKNYGQFFVGRLIIGLSYIGHIGGPLLIAEIAYPTHRSIITALYSTTFYTGAIIASSITYGTLLHVTGDSAWRIPSYLQAALAVITIGFYPWLPESPRYLVNIGKSDEARRLLIKYHANDDEVLGKDLVDFELKEIETAIAYEKISKNTSFSAFFKTKNNFHRLFISVYTGIVMNFSGNALISYYLTLVLNSIGITDTKKQLQINLALSCFNWANSLFSAYLTDKIRRRPMFLISISAMLISYTIWTILSAVDIKTGYQHQSLSNGVLAMIFLFNFGYNFAFNVLPALYASETLPYHLRGQGYSAQNFSCMAVGIFNSFVNPIAMDAIGWRYYIVYCCVLAVHLVVVYFTFVETFGYTLEEVSELVFKEDATEVVLNHESADLSKDLIE
ncbi:hypothetical protein WICMUC_001351 [Wickerhamomyces mucosus]|uniref:Major facilitator superfamily (MFS) profile domain-containing protein n=1 Tax=Wickerhamomyces mucosus TaxID=1378264 RepID=A0A9P8PWK7_9ASCO|nr:hypothetical protein WICMUC_001351 [Wickerhamomyces mucosus]